MTEQMKPRRGPYAATLKEAKKLCGEMNFLQAHTEMLNDPRWQTAEDLRVEAGRRRRALMQAFNERFDKISRSPFESRLESFYVKGKNLPRYRMVRKDETSSKDKMPPNDDVVWDWLQISPN